MTFGIHAHIQRLRHLGAVVVVVAGLAGCTSASDPEPKSRSSATTSTQASNPAPPIGPVVLGGISSIDSVLSRYQGRWILVNVWATWCRPCVAETPDLVALRQSLVNKPFELVGISADYMTSPTSEEAFRKVRDFGARFQIQYPNVIFSGSTDELTARFSLSGSIPATILYDPQGREVERWVGKLEHGDLERIKGKVS